MSFNGLIKILQEVLIKLAKRLEEKIFFVDDVQKGKQIIVKIIETCVYVYYKGHSNICAQLFGVHFKKLH